MFSSYLWKIFIIHVLVLLSFGISYYIFEYPSKQESVDDRSKSQSLHGEYVLNRNLQSDSKLQHQMITKTLPSQFSSEGGFTFGLNVTERPKNVDFTPQNKNQHVLSSSL